MAILLEALVVACFSSLALSRSTCEPILSTNTTPSLNLTAITTRDGASVFECWRLPGFAPSAGAGTVGALNLALGGLDNGTFTVLPPRFDGGLHKAPHSQLVVFLSGLAHLTLPNSTAEAWVTGGKYGVIIADDEEAEYGHITRYPSAEATVALQIPFKNGMVPSHEVAHDGPCILDEMVGI